MNKLFKNLTYIHIWKFITIKKNHMNKKSSHPPVYQYLKIYNHKKEPYE